MTFKVRKTYFKGDLFCDTDNQKKTGYLAPVQLLSVFFFAYQLRNERTFSRDNHKNLVNMQVDRESIGGV